MMPHRFSSLPEVPYNLCSAWLYDAVCGPRREITTFQLLFPKGSNGNGLFHNAGPFTLAIRFGGIENLEDVKAFFSEWPNNWNYRAVLHGLWYDRLHPSKPGSLYLTYRWDNTGDEILIHCRNMRFRVIPGEDF